MRGRTYNGAYSLQFVFLTCATYTLSHLSCSLIRLIDIIKKKLFKTKIKKTNLQILTFFYCIDLPEVE